MDEDRAALWILRRESSQNFCSHLLTPYVGYGKHFTVLLVRSKEETPGYGRLKITADTDVSLTQ